MAEPPGMGGSERSSYTGATLQSPSQPTSPAPAPRALRVAYLLSRYPAVSHTFFLKEVLGLRERGLTIEVASINPPDRSRAELPPVEVSEADATFYVKPSNLLAAAFQILRIAILHPVVTLRGLAAALCLGGWDLKARAFALFYLLEALLVGDWMRRRFFSHLHVHFGGAVATVGMLISQAWRISWSLTLHGPDEFFDQGAFYLRQKIGSASFVICISDFCRSQLLRIAPKLDTSRIEVVRLGVDCTQLQPFNADADLVSGDPASEPACLKLACTGRMVSAKGHRILLEALARMAAAEVDFSCTLIGDGPERPFLEDLAGRLGIGDRLRFLGAMAHGPTLAEVARADVFVLASFAEGLPVALMEAMALGVPCVSTMIAAIPELIVDDENGLLVPAANADALSAALQRLASDAAYRRQLGRSARATVEGQYNLARNLDLLAETWSRRLTDHRKSEFA